MTVTRKHFERIADALGEHASHTSEAAMDDLIERLSEVFYEVNPRFIRGVFAEHVWKRHNELLNWATTMPPADNEGEE
jgi:hypothetical protein